jgi:hypothetical protein
MRYKIACLSRNPIIKWLGTHGSTGGVSDTHDYLVSFGHHSALELDCPAFGELPPRKLDDLIARRTCFIDRPTPFDEFPSAVCDRLFIRSIRSRALPDGVNDLFVARKTMIRDIACQNLPVTVNCGSITKV